MKDKIKNNENRKSVGVYDMEGKKTESISLPAVFGTPLNTKVIKRAVWAIQAGRRQPYGSDKMAGQRSSAHYHGKREYRYAMMNKEMARMSRIHGGGYMSWTARNVPQAVKGRRAHPPKTEKIWKEKVNKKERLLAIRSAIAATASEDLAKKRGHILSGISLPLVVSNEFEDVKKSKDMFNAFLKLGLKEELERSKKKKVRAGKGKIRGRRYKRKKGPLVVVSRKSNAFLAARNIAGVDVIVANNLNVELLAPGAQPGRLAIFTKNALTEIDKKFGK